MCGRFTLHTEKELLARQFETDLGEIGALPPRYNIAPGEQILTIRQREDRRIAEWIRWGLVPHWSRPLEKLPLMINARVETVATKPSYRDPFRQRRCIVLANGFYEWQSIDPRSPRTPHWISLASGEAFGMAALWDFWRARDEPDSDPLVTCSIVTAPANRAIELIHPRMPVILPVEAARRWIDPALDGQTDALLTLLEPVGPEALRAHPVSPEVNTPRNDDASLIEPVENPRPTLFQLS